MATTRERSQARCESRDPRTGALIKWCPRHWPDQYAQEHARHRAEAGR